MLVWFGRQLEYQLEYRQSALQLLPLPLQFLLRLRLLPLLQGLLRFLLLLWLLLHSQYQNLLPQSH